MNIDRQFRRRRLKEKKEEIHAARRRVNKQRRENKRSEISKEGWEIFLFTRAMRSLEVKPS